jgi:integrase
MAKRRAHGEGSIRQRKDGRWEARVQLSDGKRRSYFAPTQREVIAKLREAVRRDEDGLEQVSSKSTVKEFIERWVEDVARERNAASTYRSYKERMRIDIVPHLGDTPLTKLTPQQVQRWMSKLRELEKSPRTVQYSRAVLRVALNDALRWGLVNRNVAALASPPSVERPKIVPLTVEQAKALIAAVRGTRWQALYQIALGLGMRKGEITALRWADVNLATGQLTVRRAKTRAGERTLELPAVLVEALRSHKVIQDEEQLWLGEGWNKDNLVFCSEAGVAYNPSNLHKSYKGHLRLAGLPEATRFHDLRHSCAGYLLSEGVPLKTVSDILGHSQISITADYYGHISPKAQREALETVRGFVG